jgi:hypothetical protein
VEGGAVVLELGGGGGGSAWGSAVVVVVRFVVPGEGGAVVVDAPVVWARAPAAPRPPAIRSTASRATRNEVRLIM